MKILAPYDLRSGHQVTKRGTMPGPNFNFLYAPVLPTVSDRFLSNSQGVLSLPSCATYRPFLYIADLRSAGGHDLVMLSLLENFEIAPTPKTLDIFASFLHFCASLHQYVAIRQ